MLIRTLIPRVHSGLYIPRSGSSFIVPRIPLQFDFPSASRFNMALLCWSLVFGCLFLGFLVRDPGAQQCDQLRMLVYAFVYINW